MQSSLELMAKLLKDVKQNQQKKINQNHKIQDIKDKSAAATQRKNDVKMHTNLTLDQ